MNDSAKPTDPGDPAGRLPLGSSARRRLFEQRIEVYKRGILDPLEKRWHRLFRTFDRFDGEQLHTFQKSRSDDAYFRAYLWCRERQWRSERDRQAAVLAHDAEWEALEKKRGEVAREADAVRQSVEAHTRSSERSHRLLAAGRELESCAREMRADGLAEEAKVWLARLAGMRELAPPDLLPLSEVVSRVAGLASERTAGRRWEAACDWISTHRPDLREALPDALPPPREPSPVKPPHPGAP